MNERSKMISKLVKVRETRESYIRSKLSVLLPAQIRSLRLRREMKQAELGAEADMKQARISLLERVGEVSFSMETLIKLASALRVGLQVKFVPMSEMLEWENSFMPDEFDVVPVEKDLAFINNGSVQAESSIRPEYEMTGGVRSVLSRRGSHSFDENPKADDQFKRNIGNDDEKS